MSAVVSEPVSATVVIPSLIVVSSLTKLTLMVSPAPIVAGACEATKKLLRSAVMLPARPFVK